MHVKADSISAVDEIVKFNKDRDTDLVQIKFQRMSESAFAFFRGTDHLFARRWSDLAPKSQGPGVLLCGDLHLENVGAFRTDDGDFLFDINDFDEALVAPCSLDVVRCATSILLAGVAWKIPTLEVHQFAIDFLTSYRAVIAAGTLGQISAKVGSGGPVRELLGETALGDPAQLLARHTQLDTHGRRTIQRDKDKHPDINDKHADWVRGAVEQYGANTPTPDAYRVLDITGRILGIGSLGVRRYLVLTAGGGTADTQRLFDVKEATVSSVLRCSSFPQPDTHGNEALRVVEAQRQLQAKPAAGLAVLKIHDHDFRMREMIPNENRSKLDRLQSDPAKLRQAVAVVGQLTAWSHLRGCQRQPAGADRELADWAASPALDDTLASAIDFARVTQQDYQAFAKSFAAHELR